MGTRCLIDSNAVIGYLDNKIPDNGMKFMNSLVDDDIPNISVITKIEVLRFNAPDNAYKILTNFTNNASVYDLNNDVVDATISICKSHKIKLPDAIIAATALIYELILITRNTKDLEGIPGLQIVDPWAL